MENSTPIFHFTVFTGLQVILELAFEICFLFGSANPPFSHDDEGKEVQWRMCESKSTKVVSWYETKIEKKRDDPDFKYGWIVYFGSHYLTCAWDKIEISKKMLKNVEAT